MRGNIVFTRENIGLEASTENQLVFADLVFGDIVIVGQPTSRVSYRLGLAKREFREFLVLCLSGVMLTVLNPNGIDAIIGNQAELAGPFVNVIDEFFSLWSYTELYQSRALFHACVAISAITAYYMIRYWRKNDWIYPVLALGFLVQGFSTFRFSYFLIIMLPALAASYIQADSTRLFKVKPDLVWFGFGMVLLVLGVFAVQRTAFVTGPWERGYFPSDAAYFLYQKQPTGNLFNAFEYGGYLAWQLYPNKVFIDQRNLDYTVYQDYQLAMQGEYKKIFEKHAINTVIFYNRQPVLNGPVNLPVKLLQDDEWSLVYIDSIASVLVRKRYRNSLPELDKNQALMYLQSGQNLNRKTR